MYKTLHTNFLYKSQHSVDQISIMFTKSQNALTEEYDLLGMKNPCKYQNHTSVTRAIDLSAYRISSVAASHTMLGPHPKEQHPNNPQSSQGLKYTKKPNPLKKGPLHHATMMHTTKTMWGDTWLSGCHTADVTSVQVQHCPDHMTSVYISPILPLSNPSESWMLLWHSIAWQIPIHLTHDKLSVLCDAATLHNTVLVNRTAAIHSDLWCLYTKYENLYCGKATPLKFLKRTGLRLQKINNPQTKVFVLTN